MARLLTTGFELNRVGTVNTEPDGQMAGTLPPTVVNSPVRSGGFAAKCDSGVGNASSFVTWIQPAWAASTTYFMRVYFCFAQLSGTAAQGILSLGLQTANGVSIRMNTSGQLALFDNEAAAQVGSLSSALVADSATWYRVELSIQLDGSSHGIFSEAAIDGNVFASGTIAQTAVPTVVRVGWGTAPGASKVVYLDDVAVNDSTGTIQTDLPGSGKVVCLIPTATSAAGTGWVLGNNTAEGGNGWNSVNNEPPTGQADLAGAGADATQIRNATAAANSNFDATMTTYTAAGLAAGASVKVISPIIATASVVVTSAKQGTVGVASNPTIANIALGAGGTSGAFWSGATAATYPTGWKWSYGTATYNPSVTLGTAPVMRVTQVTSSTRIAMVCFMGMYVEYVPALELAPREQVVLQAMNRAGNF